MLKKIVRVLLIIVVVILLAAGAGLAYLRYGFPKPGPVVEFKVENPSDPTLIARGSYLANHVANCIACHTPRQVGLFSVPPYDSPDSIGKGGMAFTRNLGFPGNIYSKNITPDKETGLGNWTDAQIYHTLTTGVDLQNEPLFPVMPYTHYRTADPEDLKAIIAYIRTLRPVSHKVLKSEIDFPVSFIIRTVPQPAANTRKPDPSDSVKYGEYLVNLGSCSDCHTKMEKGKPIEGMEFAGGNEYNLGPMGIARSANITPDPETGIGKWSEQNFVEKIKFFARPENRGRRWQDVGYQTVMPYEEIAGMTESDLRSIYQYLRTLKPVKHLVTKYSPAG